MIFEMLRWWYSTGWLQAAQRVIIWTERVERVFSLHMLLKTLLAPWRRIITPAGRSLDAKFRAALDNLVSRFVGFFVRIFVLIGASITISITFLVAVAMVVVWPFMPIAVIYCVVRGIV